MWDTGLCVTCKFRAPNGPRQGETTQGVIVEDGATNQPRTLRHRQGDFRPGRERAGSMGHWEHEFPQCRLSSKYAASPGVCELSFHSDL